MLFSVSSMSFTTSLLFLSSSSCKGNTSHWDRRRHKVTITSDVAVKQTLNVTLRCWRCVTLPLDVPSLPPTRPSRGSHISRCHTHSTQTFCPACSNKPEASYGDHTAAWLSPLRSPSQATLCRMGPCCLQPQSGLTGTHCASGWAWCRTSRCRLGTWVRHQAWSLCPSMWRCTFDKRCDHRGWLQGFGSAPGIWHRSDLNSENPYLTGKLTPLRKKREKTQRRKERGW